VTPLTAAGDGSGSGLDPVTFEVMRHRLWAINDEQGRMAARLSGSPTVYERFDFNAALTTGDGHGLYTGVYIMHHGATIDEFVRKVMGDWKPEEIRPGDMFFTNDPWWGALHANDGILAAPIFWRDRLVAWSGIVMHDNDVGGQVPGSFVAGARDRFDEAPLFPAVKMVENFVTRRDVERAYLRNSRSPEHNALNMRARVAALKSTYRRVQEVIESYGIEAFLSTQEQMLDYVEDVVRGRLRAIPDGEWFANGYHDHDSHREVMYPICCAMTKRGDSLTFDMTGTAPQAPGPINCARPALDAAIIGMVLTFFCYDLPWTIGALRRIVDVQAQEGTLNNAMSPAAVSMASVMATLTTQDLAAHVLAKMLLCSERQRAVAQATWTPGVYGMRFASVDERGRQTISSLGDGFGGGGGARTFTDGIDSGGIFHSMASRISNAETLESEVPILHLYRRELRDSGGPGRFRGGVALESAFSPHKVVGEGTLVTIASGVSLPAGQGLAGGAPGIAVSNRILRASDIRERLADGRPPVSETDITAGRLEVQPAKALTTLAEGDVLIGVVAGGAGFGDPLRRDPHLIARDLARGLVSEPAARDIYGLVLVDGEPDLEATRELRSSMRDTRRREARRPDGEHPAGAVLVAGVAVHPVSDAVEAVDCDGERILRCGVCHYRYGAYSEPYLAATLVRELPLSASVSDNDRCSARFVLAERYCPGCGTAVAATVSDRSAATSVGDRVGPRA
jgi:N-methylhydantoinase B/oxoprolinase/acetone carboxylase alpha subunit